MSLLWAKRGWLTPGSQTIRTLDRFGATDVWDFVDNSYMRAGVVTTNAGLTVTRASDGYAETSDGTLVNFGSNVLRRTDKGVLAEGARTNLLLRSQDFNNGTWVKTDAVAATGAAVSPDGTITANSITENAANSSHQLWQRPSITNGTVYALSFFAKSNGRNRIVVQQFNSSAAYVGANFDLLNGTVVATNGASAVASIVALANGWYRCVLVGTADATATSYMDLSLAQDTHTGTFSETYTGDGTSGIFLWGAQLEVGAFASSYIPTVASTVTRAADEVTASLSSVAYPCSLYAEFVRNGDTGAAEGVFQIDASSRAQRANINVSSSDTLTVTARGGTNDGDAAVAGAVTVGAITKGAGRVAVDDVQAGRAGSLATADTAASVPTSSPDTVRFGDFGAAATHGFLYLRRAAVISSALTDAQLQAITT